MLSPVFEQLEDEIEEHVWNRTNNQSTSTIAFTALREIADTVRTENSFSFLRLLDHDWVRISAQANRFASLPWRSVFSETESV